jgi:hypothetical protein
MTIRLTFASLPDLASKNGVEVKFAEVTEIAYQTILGNLYTARI